MLCNADLKDEFAAAVGDSEDDCDDDVVKVIFFFLNFQTKKSKIKKNMEEGSSWVNVSMNPN